MRAAMSGGGGAVRLEAEEARFRADDEGGGDVGFEVLQIFPGEQSTPTKPPPPPPPPPLIKDALSSPAMTVSTEASSTIAAVGSETAFSFVDRDDQNDDGGHFSSQSSAAQHCVGTRPAAVQYPRTEVEAGNDVQPSSSKRWGRGGLSASKIRLSSASAGGERKTMKKKKSIKAKLRDAAGIGRQWGLRGDGDWIDAMDAAAGMGDVSLDYSEAGSSSSSGSSSKEEEGEGGDEIFGNVVREAVASLHDDGGCCSSSEGDDESSSDGEEEHGDAQQQQLDDDRTLSGGGNTGGRRGDEMTTSKSKRGGLKSRLSTRRLGGIGGPQSSRRLQKHTDRMDAAAGMGDVEMCDTLSCDSSLDEEEMASRRAENLAALAEENAALLARRKEKEARDRKQERDLADGEGAGKDGGAAEVGEAAEGDSDAAQRLSQSEVAIAAVTAAVTGALVAGPAATKPAPAAPLSSKPPKRRGLTSRLKSAAGIGRQWASRKDDWLDSMDAAAGMGDVELDEDASVTSSSDEDEGKAQLEGGGRVLKTTLRGDSDSCVAAGKDEEVEGNHLSANEDLSASTGEDAEGDDAAHLARMANMEAEAALSEMVNISLRTEKK